MMGYILETWSGVESVKGVQFGPFTWTGDKSDRLSISPKYLKRLRRSQRSVSSFVEVCFVKYIQLFKTIANHFFLLSMKRDKLQFF